jgi:hypothetical protein
MNLSSLLFGRAALVDFSFGNPGKDLASHKIVLAVASPQTRAARQLLGQICVQVIRP